MSATEIRKQLHAYIDMIDDEDKLEMLNEAAEVYATQQQDILDFLTPEQLERLNDSIKQADESKTISHEDVKKISREWLKKKIRWPEIRSILVSNTIGFTIVFRMAIYKF